jgi:hypothetical protein
MNMIKTCYSALIIFEWIANDTQTNRRSSSFEELYGAAISVLRRAIAEVKHVKLLVPAAFAVVSSHQPALGPLGGLWSVLLMCNP